jgi:hypothetical protein
VRRQRRERMAEMQKSRRRGREARDEFIHKVF